MNLIPEAIGSLLHRCAKSKAFRGGISLHAAVVKMGLHSDIIVSNHVLNVYAKCGNMGLARKVFDEMSERNLVSWSAMISGYDQSGEPLMAMKLFSQMQLRPNEYVFASAISACASLRAVVQGQQIHAHAVKVGYAVISFVANSLISMYMKCGFCRNALSVHETSLEPCCVSYNALIAGFVENGELDSGFEVFKLMHQQGLVPDCFSFVGALSSCSDMDSQRGIVLHCQTVKLMLDRTNIVGNVIITMYSKLNLIDDAEKAFRLIEEKDILSWNTIISSCSHCVDHARGLRFFKEMMDEFSGRPDDFTIASGLTACAGLASMRHGKQIHSHLIRARLHEDVGVSNALMNMYAKCGCIGYAHDIFNRMHHPNLVSWNTVIAGFGNHGLGERAIEIFEQMKKADLKPDPVTFVGILTACNHAGLVDRGRSYFNSMEETYGLAPDIEHFSCLIDLLGRAGRLVEAEEYMRKFPSFGKDTIVLGSLLSACRLHGDVEIGERLARRLVKLQPVTSSPYVLLSNLYALDEMWESVAKARRMLKGSGLKKEPGHSLIEVKGTFEKFIKGDFSHSRIQEIKHTLNILSLAVPEVSLECYLS